MAIQKTAMEKRRQAMEAQSEENNNDNNGDK